MNIILHHISYVSKEKENSGFHVRINKVYLKFENVTNSNVISTNKQILAIRKNTIDLVWWGPNIHFLNEGIHWTHLVFS